jgi:hypothetical protein
MAMVFFSVDDHVVNLNAPGEAYDLAASSLGSSHVLVNTLNPLTDFTVEKDISLQGGGAGSDARISVIQQGYSRGGSTRGGGVPEPGSIALLGIGVAGAFGIFRRRKPAQATT